MNPFDMGLLSLSMANNPELFSQAMAAQGISPTAIANPNVPPGINQMDPLAALFTPSMQPGASAPQAPTAMQQSPTSALGMLGAIKGPTVPAPIMNAGVSGSQKAPEMSVGGKGSTQVNDAIMAMLLNGGQGNPQVPTLATLLKGV